MEPTAGAVARLRWAPAKKSVTNLGCIALNQQCGNFVR